MKYVESPAQYLERLAFEDSHTFKVGNLVYLSAEGIADLGDILSPLYADIKGKVSRVVTTSGTGPCIAVFFGGVNINIWNPTAHLILCDGVTEVLYE